MTFDYAAYLDTLPQVNMIRASRQPRGLRQWNYPPLGPYNGFSGIERVNGWRFMWWMTESGCLPWPQFCDICGEKKAAWHSESYYHPNRMSKLCNKCHMSLHKRIAKPGPWQEIVARYAVTGKEWFALLPTDMIIDIAAHLRRQRPEENIANLYTSTLFANPVALLAPGIQWTDARTAPDIGEHTFTRVVRPSTSKGIAPRVPQTTIVKIRHRTR